MNDVGRPPIRSNNVKSSSLKIAINTRFLLPDRPLEGLGRYTHDLCRELVRQHPKDEFLFLFDRPFDPKHVFADHVTPLVLRPPARDPVTWLMWFEGSVKRALERHRVDVFFSPDNYGVLRSSVPQVVVCHDLGYEHFPEQVPLKGRYFYPFFFPKYLKKADAVVAISTSVQQDLVTHYRLPEQKITVVPNGYRGGFHPMTDATVQQFRRLQTGGAPYFFYVGAIQPRKNLTRLVRAFDTFKTHTGSNTKLVIGGRMAWKTGRLREAIEHSEYRTDILLPGFISDAELPEWMAAARAFVYPSLFEGFGLPLLEAMHAEVPVLTSNVSSLPEVAGRAALLIQPDSTEDIARGLAELDQNAPLRAELVERGREQRTRFSWARAAETVYEVLRRAVDGSSPEPS